MDNYSVPMEARRLLHEGIIHNPLHRSLYLPSEIEEAARMVQFKGGPIPAIPVNWRFAEAISAIKGFQGAMVNILLRKRYGLEYQRIEINTDHASLFITSVLLAAIDPFAENVTIYDRPQLYKYIPNGDKSGLMLGTNLQTACTNIYKTKDGRFFYLHGSLNPKIVQNALGLPTHDASSNETLQEATSIYAARVAQYTAAELETLMNDQNRQAGTTCLSPQEYKDSDQGRANAHVGLYEVHHIQNEIQEPVWWDAAPTVHMEGDKNHSGVRPLLGVKVVDLSRIIAGPTITRELAELGASVMRVTSPNVTDPTDLLIDLGWGKWNAHLDLKTIQGRDKLKELVLEADVVVDGYRPGVMEKYGFGKDAVLSMFEGRTKGVVYARENCYGWSGPFRDRSGWQQISDANCGVSYEYGRAIASDGPVAPIFPNADYSTGVAGATGIIQALIQRAEQGGSFVIDIALNYYNQWLINSASTYPDSVWESIWNAYGKMTFKPSESMMFNMSTHTLRLLRDNFGERLFKNDEFFEIRENKAIEKDVKTLRPVLQFVEQNVILRYNVGFRGNGVDKPKWPEDLMLEIVR